MEHDSRITSREPFYDRRNEVFGDKAGASNPHFPSSRVGEELDLLDSLAEIVKHGRPAIEQRATVFGWRDPLAVAIEQAHAERMLQFRDRSRNVGLGGVKALRRLSHGASLHYGHENVQVLQLQPASDAIA